MQTDMLGYNGYTYTIMSLVAELWILLSLDSCSVCLCPILENFDRSLRYKMAGSVSKLCAGCLEVCQGVYELV